MFDAITATLAAHMRTRHELAGGLAELDERIASVLASMAELDTHTAQTDAEREAANAVRRDAQAALERAQAARDSMVAQIDADTADLRDLALEVLQSLGRILPEVPPEAADDPPLASYDAELEAAAADVPEDIRDAVLAEVREYGNGPAVSAEVVAQLASMRTADIPLVPGIARRIEHFIRRNIWADVRLARAAVEDRRHHQLVAIDAGTVHHNLIGAFGSSRMEPDESHGRVEFHAPGMQLAFDLDGQTTSDALIRWLTRISAGGLMLRHWVGLLSMWSEHGRSSVGLWMPTEHLRRIGLTDTTRNRRAAEEAVETLLASRIIVDAPGTCGRCACPLKWCGCSQPMRAADGRARWEMRLVSEVARGLDWQSRRTPARFLRAEPPIYAGVRLLDADGAPGRVGRNHAWLTPEIARCGPQAIALAARVSIRMHWDKAPELVLERDRAMAAAEIKRSLHYPGRSRAALDDALKELRAVGYVVTELDGNKVIFRPPPAVRDRLLGVAPRDALPHDPTRDPTTGAELRAWRLGHERTQQDAAAELGVALRTYERWEAAAALPRGAAQKIRAAMAPGEGGSRIPRQRKRRPRKRT